MAEQEARYRVIEPTFQVDGEGTPADALEFVLNQQAEEGYVLAATVPVRGADEDGRADEEYVQVLVLERRE